jgi:hypothetical protein
MKVCDAESKINAVQVTEVTVSNFPDTGTIVNAVYALVEFDPKQGKVVGTHGKCTANPKNWSDDTLQLMTELLASMEADLLPRHFTTQRNPSMENNNVETRTKARGLEEADQV